MNDKSDIAFRDGMLQICIESPGCRYRKLGHCRMCNYGEGRLLDEGETLTVVRNAFSIYPDASKVLLNSFGSFLDFSEVPHWQSVLRYINRTGVREVYIETHCETVGNNLLSTIERLIPQKLVTIEMGLESATPEVLTSTINKYLSLDRLVETIDTIHAHKMRVALNVLYGIWGMTEAEQNEEFLNTIRWADEHGADEIVVFPLLVKPHTELMDLYQRGEFTPPSLKRLNQVLDLLDFRLKQKIGLSKFYAK